MTATITTAIATRQGTSSNNADGAATFAGENGDVAAAVIDIAGHHPNAPAIADLLAQTTVRVATHKGDTAALLTAGLLVADDGANEDAEPDGVAVCAVAHPDGDTDITWIGDSQAHSWDGHTLTRLTTPHTVGEQLRRRYNISVDVSQAADDVITTRLGSATPATVIGTSTTDPLVILTTDGADYLPDGKLQELIAMHADNPQGLAGAIVTAAEEDANGYRDDVTVVVIARR